MIIRIRQVIVYHLVVVHQKNKAEDLVVGHAVVAEEVVVIFLDDAKIGLEEGEDKISRDFFKK